MCMCVCIYVNIYEYVFIFRRKKTLKCTVTNCCGPLVVSSDQLSSYSYHRATVVYNLNSVNFKTTDYMQCWPRCVVTHSDSA